jgi:hypothetical protein
MADARGAAAVLKARGAEVVMGPVENTTEIFFFVRDNSGNAFELIQYKRQSGLTLIALDGGS